MSVGRRHTEDVKVDVSFVDAGRVVGSTRVSSSVGDLDVTDGQCSARGDVVALVSAVKRLTVE